jgi:hypothetical protein
MAVTRPCERERLDSEAGKPGEIMPGFLAFELMFPVSVKLGQVWLRSDELDDFLTG